MDIMNMHDNKSVIVWTLPEPIESEKTVELITKKEQTIFNEFMLTCATAIVPVITLIF